MLNGSNLNMLGQREPELYGPDTLDDVRALCERVAEELGFELFFAQSNAEHQIVEWVQEAFRQKATVVINPAGFSFQSVPLLDALHMLAAPIVEIHITNIGSENECQTAYFEIFVEPVSSVAIAVTCEPFAGKK